jgi:hypothetical protein
MAYTLADLLTPRLLDDVRSAFLGSLQGAGFPALTEWVPKAGVEMAYVDMIARALAEVVAVDEPDIAASGFLGLAQGIWSRLLARNTYRLNSFEATSTTFNLQFRSAPTAPPFNFGPGDVTVTGPSGSRYHNEVAFSVSPGALSEAVPFIASEPGSAFNDNPTPGSPNQVNFTLVTGFAGLTVVTAAADFAAVLQTGQSTGQIEPVRAGASAPLPHTFVITMTSSGEIGTATFDLSLDGGPREPQGALLASQDFVDGTRILATPGGSAPSFLAGDTFTVVTPGGPNYVQGSDAETEEQLASRCRARWPSLSANPTGTVFELWAKQAYPVASRIRATPDTVTPGQVNLVVADSHGPISSVSAEIIETFIAPRLGPLDSVRVRPATALGIVTTGTITVTKGSAALVKARAQENWALYLGSVLLGATVEVSELEQAVMDAGAVDVDLESLTINGVSGSQELDPGVVPVDANSGGLAVAMTWVFA